MTKLTLKKKETSLQLKLLSVSQPYLFYQLPIVSTLFAVKNFVHNLRSKFLRQSTAVEDLQREIQIAEHQKNVLNSMKLQRLIVLTKKMILRAIRNNESLLMIKVGRISQESKILANNIEHYFSEAIKCETNQLHVNGSLYVYMEIIPEQL